MIRPLTALARILLVIIAVALSLALASCRKPATVPLGQPFDLHIGQVARVRDSDVELYFRRVAADSRCPHHARCIVAGEARITLEGRVMKGTPETFDLALPAAEASSEPAGWRDYDGYRVLMVRLQPYPEAGVPADTTAYVATLRVEKR